MGQKDFVPVNILYPGYMYSLHDESSFYVHVFYIGICELIVQQENNFEKKCKNYLVIMTKNVLRSTAVHVVKGMKKE